jgi:RHS repeat-associated protein
MISSVLHKNTASNRDLTYRQYWRDDRDRITAWKRRSDNFHNGMEDGRGDRYHYDPEGQLDLASYRAANPEGSPGPALRADSFQYDKLGNRMGSNYVASRGAMNFTRKDNGLNQYSAWWPYSATSYDDDIGEPWGTPHHANGVLMLDGWITAGFNALNQPICMWSPMYPGGPSANWMWFGYDPLGRCVKRWVGPLIGGHVPPANTNPATYYYYDGWNLIQEGPSGGADRVYVHGGRIDEIVASQAGGVWSHHQYDAQGNCIMLTDTGGGIREQYDYDAFGLPYFYNFRGDRLGGTNRWGNRFLFTGREWLQDLKVYDYRNRMYQPELGRFLQPDPKQFEAGDYNLYRYCHNDPVNKSDPTGLSVTSDTWNDLMRFQGNSQYSSTVDRKLRQLHADGWVTTGHIEITMFGKPADSKGFAGFVKAAEAIASKVLAKTLAGHQEYFSRIEKNASSGERYTGPIRSGNGVTDYADKYDQGRAQTSTFDNANLHGKGWRVDGFVLGHLFYDRDKIDFDMSRLRDHSWYGYFITPAVPFTRKPGLNKVQEIAFDYNEPNPHLPTP